MLPLPLTTTRMQAIMVDADLGRPRRNLTPEEDDFRDEVEVELKAAHERGERLEFTSELP